MITETSFTHGRMAWPVHDRRKEVWVRTTTRGERERGVRLEVQIYMDNVGNVHTTKFAHISSTAPSCKSEKGDVCDGVCSWKLQWDFKSSTWGARVGGNRAAKSI